MLYRAHLQLFIVLLLAGGAVFAQSAETKPVTKSDILVALEAGRESAELLKKTNTDLIAAIKERGVDFVLTPEEEWQLEMRDAGEDLLVAVREAIDPNEREARITANRQQGLYNQFAANYNSNDLAGRQTAVTAAREFLQLYADDPNVAEIVTFMQRNLPRLEQSVTMMAQREEAMQRARAMALERQQQMQRQREERDRRRQEASAGAANAANPQGDRNAVSPNGRSNKDDTPRQPSDPVVRQPSDPVYRTPRYPVVRRP